MAVLMGDHINQVFFTRKCMAILPGGKKSGCNNKVTVSPFDEFRLNMLIFMVSVTENFPLRLSLNINTGQKDSREVLETTF